MAQFSLWEIQRDIAANPDLINSTKNLRRIGDLLWDARLAEFRWDMNGDGLFTVTDVTGWLWSALTLPGDLLIITTMRAVPGLAQFLELSPSSVASTASHCFSVGMWVPVLLVVVGLLRVKEGRV